MRYGVLASCLALLTGSATVWAGYELQPAALTSGGGRLTNASTVVVDATLGGIVGCSTNATHVGKLGYAGQLYEVVSLSVTAQPPTLDELATRQLEAVEVCDDDSLLAPDSAPDWAVLSGPLASIDSNGLATATNVYQDTLASAQAEYRGRTGSVELTVLNVGTDDYLSYAGDELPDDWQVLYFGEENTNAAPGRDPDLDTQSNLYEWVYGTVPTTDVSRFEFWMEPMSGVQEARLAYEPAFTSRTYQVEWSTNLPANDWTNLLGYIEETNGMQRIATDIDATEPLRFYRIRVEYNP